MKEFTDDVMILNVCVVEENKGSVHQKKNHIKIMFIFVLFAGAITWNCVCGAHSSENNILNSLTVNS